MSLNLSMVTHSFAASEHSWVCHSTWTAKGTKATTASEEWSDATRGHELTHRADERAPMDLARASARVFYPHAPRSEKDSESERTFAM